MASKSVQDAYAAPSLPTCRSRHSFQSRVSTCSGFPADDSAFQVARIRKAVQQLKRFEGASTNSIEIDVEHSGVDAIVRLKGRIDVDSSPDVRDRLQAILSSVPHPHAVTVDLGSVTSIEASGIATLIEALKLARHHHIRFNLQGHGSVLQLFESTGLLALFDIGASGKGSS